MNIKARDLKVGDKTPWGVVIEEPTRVFVTDRIYVGIKGAGPHNVRGFNVNDIVKVQR